MFVCFLVYSRVCVSNFFVPCSVSSDRTGPRYTSRDWQGIRSPVDAAMVGRIHLSPKPTPPPPARRRSSRRRKPTKKRGRKTRHVFDDLFGLDDLFDYSDYSDYSDIMVESATRTQEYTPVQNVYFFKRGENPRSHFCLLVVLKTEATRIKHILCNLLPFCFFSRRQINTTEWI